MAKILVAEDNGANLDLARFPLTAAGHAVTVAQDGLRGLAAAQLALADLITGICGCPAWMATP